MIQHNWGVSAFDWYNYIREQYLLKIIENQLYQSMHLFHISTPINDPMKKINKSANNIISKIYPPNTDPNTKPRSRSHSIDYNYYTKSNQIISSGSP